jgi:hypothetical protein
MNEILNDRIVSAHQQYEKKLNWDDAVLYCSLLAIDGYDDWRMPTILELEYLSHVSPNDAGKYYWSSDVRNDDSVCVQFFDENVSRRHQIYQSKSNQYFVRPVRNAV